MTYWPEFYMTKIRIFNNIFCNLKYLETSGKTVILVSMGGTLSGMIALADIIKPNARETLDLLGKNVIEIKKTKVSSTCY